MGQYSILKYRISIWISMIFLMAFTGTLRQCKIPINLKPEYHLVSYDCIVHNNTDEPIFLGVWLSVDSTLKLEEKYLFPLYPSEADYNKRIIQLRDIDVWSNRNFWRCTALFSIEEGAAKSTHSHKEPFKHLIKYGMDEYYLYELKPDSACRFEYHYDFYLYPTKEYNEQWSFYAVPLKLLNKHSRSGIIHKKLITQLGSVRRNMFDPIKNRQDSLKAYKYGLKYENRFEYDGDTIRLLTTEIEM